jgi:hypothetical protein
MEPLQSECHTGTQIAAAMNAQNHSSLPLSAIHINSALLPLLLNMINALRKIKVNVLEHNANGLLE